MKLRSVLALGASLLCAASASPVAADFEDEPLEKRASTFPIAGAQNGGLQPRLEIRTMAAENPDQFNLYLLAMNNFKSMSQAQLVSYYQIAGIHGVPNIPWDGVQANPASDGAVGYCTHSSILFPTWHRVYLALFEQAFMTIVNETVGRFAAAERPRWATAASTLRIPYWDWAIAPPSGQANIPSLITNKFVVITTATGNKTLVNPLFRYNFHPLDSQGFIYGPWDYWNVTLRYPNSQADTASSQDNLDISTTNNNQLTYRQRVYNLMTNFNNYSEFSNEAWEASSTASNKDSLESIHDSIHVDLGGTSNGHMSVLWYAAFDPVFWLHHANVDRLTALWQTLYPTSWLVPTVATGSTFTIAEGSVQGSTSPLTPFHSDTVGTLWDSDGVRDWRVLGYTYPEFVDTDGSSASILQVINNNYGPSATATAEKKKRELPLGERMAAPLPSLTNSDGQRYEYLVNVVAERFGLNGSFTVFMFFNDAPSSCGDWASANNMVGSHSILATPGMQTMSMSGDPRVSGTVPLTDGLATQAGLGVLESLDQTIVVPFLEYYLNWKILKDGQSIDPSTVPGLQISVVSSLVTPPATSSECPQWGEFETLGQVTHGKPGGLQMPQPNECIKK